MATDQLGHRYSTACVSKRLTDETAACLRARYCTNLACPDLAIGDAIVLILVE